jgi:hypothetical protein
VLRGLVSRISSKRTPSSAHAADRLFSGGHAHSLVLLCEVAFVHVFWHLRLLVLAVLHRVVEMAEDRVDRVGVRRVEREEGDEVVILDLADDRDRRSALALVDLGLARESEGERTKDTIA